MTSAFDKAAAQDSRAPADIDLNAILARLNAADLKAQQALSLGSDTKAESLERLKIGLPNDQLCRSIYTATPEIENLTALGFSSALQKALSDFGLRNQRGQYYIYGSRVYAPVTSFALRGEVDSAARSIADSDIDISLRVDDLGPLQDPGGHFAFADVLGRAISDCTGFKYSFDQPSFSGLFQLRGESINIEFNFVRDDGKKPIGISICHQDRYRSIPLSSIDELKLIVNDGVATVSQPGASRYDTPQIYWRNVLASDREINFAVASKNFARLILTLERSNLFPQHLRNPAVTQSLAKEINSNPSSKILFDGVSGGGLGIKDIKGVINEKKPHLARKINSDLDAVMTVLRESVAKYKYPEPIVTVPKVATAPERTGAFSAI